MRSLPPYHWNPVRITFGAGSFEALPEVVAALPGRRVAVVTEAALLGALGLEERLRSLAPDREVAIFDGVRPNPQVADAQAAADFARRAGAEILIGLGGGSALDTAKVAAVALANGGEVAPFLTGERPLAAAALPTVMVPTTAGTGSEVTRWATLWDREARRKYSLESPGMYPTHALLDPRLTLTLPPLFTAASGMDALSHAMEAYWNRNANPLSDVYALEAVRRIFEVLPLAVAQPENEECRGRMLLASLLAGLAFSSTKTAAAHSLSYPMTLHYGVIHGQASSITLPALLCFNAAAASERMTELARATGAADVEGGARRIRALLERVGLKSTLAELGIGADGIELCAREGYTPDRADHNVRSLDPGALREVLRMVA